MLCLSKGTLYHFDLGGLKMEKGSNNLYDLKIPLYFFLTSNQCSDTDLIVLHGFSSMLDLSVCRLLFSNMIHVPDWIKVKEYCLKTYFEFALKCSDSWKYGRYFDDALKSIGKFNVDVSTVSPDDVWMIHEYVNDLTDAYSFYILTHFLESFSSFSLNQLFDNNNEMYDIISSFYYDKKEMKQLIEGIDLI